MKIRSVRIKSFGELREREYSFDDKLTVIYGKNETGKTSLMEFIRSTLFPDNKRVHYPEYRTSDHGEMDIVEDDGKMFRIVRDGKKIKSDKMPSDIVKIDVDSYQKIFAMSPDDLRDSKIISSGDIKNRFLTIPGGESISAIKSELDESMKALMSSERRSSTTEISKLMSEANENERAIITAKQINDRYSDLQKQKVELEERLDSFKSASEKVQSAVKDYAIQQSQKQNEEELEELKKRKCELVQSAVIKDSDQSTYNGLKTKVDEAKKHLEPLDDDADTSVLDGLNTESILGNRSTIERLHDRKGEHVALESNISNFTNNFESEQRKIKATASGSSDRETINKMPIFLGAAILAITVAIGILVEPLIIVVGVIIFIACIAVVFKKQSAKDVPNLSDEYLRYWEDQISVEKEKKYKLDRELEAVSRRIGIDNVSFASDVDMLYSALKVALESSDNECKVSKLKLDVDKAEAELNRFLSVFGGESRFLELLEMKKEYDFVSNNIETLYNSMKASGYDSSKPIIERPNIESVQNEIRELGIQIGRIDSEMKAIRNDDDIERLLDAEMQIQTDLFNTVKKWAVMSLASKMVDDACDSAYSDIQPGVITSANELLRMMTCGRYGLEMDLRDNRIKAISGSVGKVEGQWSTGLGDQIFLSIKLAVAKEMCKGETLPILLDDVLQMFDSDRKSNACKALLEFAENMQVMLFTCDAETFALMQDLRKCHSIELSEIV